MKIVKYILIVIGVLVVIFFGNGMLNSTISYECEVSVDKDAKESWAVMSDKSKMANWIEGYKKSELVSGKENEVGAVSNIYVEDNGQKMVMEETITALKPNELMAMTFTMDFMNMEYEISFDEKDGKTIISSKSVTEGNGIFAKSMISFMSSTMKEQEEINLNSLKVLIEENSTNYFPEPTIVEPNAVDTINE